MDQRSFQLLKEIAFYPRITRLEIMRKMEITERQLQYDIEKINIFLEEYDLPVITLKQQMFHVPEEVVKMVTIGLSSDVDLSSFILSEEDRIFIIYLYTYIRQEIISSYHYQILLGVSKNTILSDIKKVRKQCEDWHVNLTYTRAKGYYLTGSELDKRRFAAYCSDKLFSEPLGKEIIILILKNWQVENLLEDTRSVIDEMLQAHAIDYVKSRKNEMIFRLALLRARKIEESADWTNHEQDLLKRQSIYDLGLTLAQNLFPSRASEEAYFITLQLLILLQEIKQEDNPSLQILAEEIIEAFEKVTLLPLENKQFLTKSLYNHLVPAFFRITFEMPLVNPLQDRIKEEYSHLYEFVRQALAPLSMWTGKAISEDEIGFFTMHFGGHLSNKVKKTPTTLRGIIICANGISSSMMLKAQLKEMFPDMDMTSIHTVEDLMHIPTTTYDMIFSTVERNFIGKPYYTVKPLLSQVEKNYLIQQVVRDFPSLQLVDVSIDQMMNAIRKHATIHQESELYATLVELIYFNNKDKGRYLPMLSELLTEDMIQLTDEAIGWEAAIEKAATPLLSLGKVEDRYVTSMIENVKEMGPYIHIGKGVAIPHARPENGVKEIGMSLLRTNTPVHLLGQDEHAIDMFIVIAAIDSEAHLKALSSLTKILSDDDLLTKLKAATTPAEMVSIIKEGEDE